MTLARIRTAGLSGLLALVCLQSQGQQPPAGGYEIDHKRKSSLEYGVEWRLVRAGVVKLNWNPHERGYEAHLHVESQGLVSKLYRVNDTYLVQLNQQLCAEGVIWDAQEGSRHRETKITFEPSGKALYQERDLIKNSVILTKETPVPPCVFDYVGGLNRLRALKLEPGQSGFVTMTDGKKVAQVKVEAQEREQVKTSLGTFSAMRYEVHLFNDVLMARKARMYVWLTEDARRLPVQFRVRMQFLIGTITLQLEKEERN